MRITTIMKGGLIACILFSLSVDLVAQGGGSVKAPAGKTQRVRFARGRTTAILKGSCRSWNGGPVPTWRSSRPDHDRAHHIA